MKVATKQELTKIPEADKITVTIITDNLADALRLDYKIAQRHTSAATANILDRTLHAEHGLAYHIETVIDGRSHSCLFDFGADSRGVLLNLDLLQIDLRQVEALGTSHDHFDHNAACVEVLKTKRKEFSKDIPFYVGEQFFVGTYGKRPDGNVSKLNLLKREEVEELGFVRIVETKDPTPIIPGAYLSGRIEQVTEYEEISSRFLAKSGNEFVQETFVGEQAVVLNAKGKGLVVLSSCAHRGIVNTVKHAQKMTGIDKVHAVIGGCHLINAKPELIIKTVADLKAIKPDYIVPAHCTGFEAISTFAREMPDQFILNTAGTRYIISA
ncbi:MAG: MBL fold metallo-hydrolase [Candidatus Korobacteraceae bacterium]|jgi:7,8-dihydropterin-6-yl-methyl-4-(beta-D-ribofuranosyl)aminobenzene 5'-phosphate synthase